MFYSERSALDGCTALAGALLKYIKQIILKQPKYYFPWTKKAISAIEE